MASKLTEKETRRGHKKARERIVIELNSDALELFDELQEKTGASTRAELFRNLLRFAAATVDELEMGNVPLWAPADGGEVQRSTVHRMLMFKVESVKERGREAASVKERGRLQPLAAP